MTLIKCLRFEVLSAVTILTRPRRQQSSYLDVNILTDWRWRYTNL